MGTAMDRRLVLAGYRPHELALARLVLLELFGLVIAGVFSVVMVLGRGPGDAAALVAGVVLVAVLSYLMARRAPRAAVAVPR
jgi:hypothetical protein